MTILEIGSETLTIRQAEIFDVPALARMIGSLAEFHGEGHLTTETSIEAELFGPDPVLNALVASRDGEVLGMLLWYRIYSTWEAARGIHIEDLYVDPALRGSGAGMRLMARVANIAIERGYGRIEGEVVNRNSLRSTVASHGGESPDAWNLYRCKGAELADLASADIDSMSWR